MEPSARGTQARRDASTDQSRHLATAGTRARSRRTRPDSPRVRNRLVRAALRRPRQQHSRVLRTRTQPLHTPRVQGPQAHRDHLRARRALARPTPAGKRPPQAGPRQQRPDRRSPRKPTAAVRPAHDQRSAAASRPDPRQGGRERPLRTRSQPDHRPVRAARANSRKAPSRAPRSRRGTDTDPGRGAHRPGRHIQEPAAGRVSTIATRTWVHLGSGRGGNVVRGEHGDLSLARPSQARSASPAPSDDRHPVAHWPARLRTHRADLGTGGSNPWAHHRRRR